MTHRQLAARSPRGANRRLTVRPGYLPARPQGAQEGQKEASRGTGVADANRESHRGRGGEGIRGRSGRVYCLVQTHPLSAANNKTMTRLLRVTTPRDAMCQFLAVTSCVVVLQDIPLLSRHNEAASCLETAQSSRHSPAFVLCNFPPCFCQQSHISVTGWFWFSDDFLFCQLVDHKLN